MRGIYYLLTRFYVLILFVLLEFFAISLIYHSHKYQEIKFLNTSGTISGTFLSYFNNINSFIHLGTNNNVLLEENTLLKQQIEYQNLYPKDSLLPRNSLTFKFNYTAAKIVNNTINKSINYITLDKGSKDGIQKGMGVVSSNGVVGIITNVSENFSLVMSVISVKTQISVRHKKSNTLGNLYWNGENPFELQVDGFSKTLPIKSNDTLVTAGFSSIFPPDIPVAKIKRFDKDESTSFYNVDVTLTNTINSISYVYIVKNEKRKEIDSLELQMFNE
ncbi:MAG TPA: rod shape-determining protein MreC [Chitinophagales bacterium]|jgi:rod shape-determining protein MreC|nr:rod shape-determining protein MreC [Chitinophagales bacterium]MBP6154787.1 rod shape-determining protein MreC [Chitinophagales bacterium]HQV79180.1 rod shape-determining protein MreC [Chitinophagales bacterium]HQW79864.1 rod shape-determining protein MreC [Chitinophagales bacterium]HRB68352.1 rod shape-determining protein MreC [Chitinophagales bacterium]